MLLGDKIRQRRAELKLSQQAVASAVEASRPSVTDWENNKNFPKGGYILALAKVLQVSVEYLLDESVSRYVRQAIPTEGVDIQELTSAIQAVEDAAIYIDGGVGAATKAKLIAARYSLGADCQLTELVRIFTSEPDKTRIHS